MKYIEHIVNESDYTEEYIDLFKLLNKSQGDGECRHFNAEFMQTLIMFYKEANGNMRPKFGETVLVPVFEENEIIDLGY